MPVGRRERPLVEPARLVGSAARQPHAGQHDGRAQRVGDVAGGVQTAHRLGERVDRRRRGRRRPGRQAEEAGGGAAGEVVLRSGQVEGAAGVRRPCPSTSPRAWATDGAVDRDHGRQDAQLVPVARLAEPRRRGGDGAARARLGGVEPGLDPVEVALGEPRPGEGGGEQRTAPHDVVGQGVAATRAGCGPGGRRRRSGSAELDQVGGVLGVAAGQRVADGVGEQAVLGVPVGGGPVQRARPAPGRPAVSRARRASAKRWW